MMESCKEMQRKMEEMQLREGQSKALQAELENHVAVACQQLDIEVNARYLAIFGPV